MTSQNCSNRGWITDMLSKQYQRLLVRQLQAAKGFYATYSTHMQSSAYMYMYSTAHSQLDKKRLCCGRATRIGVVVYTSVLRHAGRPRVRARELRARVRMYVRYVHVQCTCRALALVHN